TKNGCPTLRGFRRVGTTCFRRYLQPRSTQSNPAQPTRTKPTWINPTAESVFAWRREGELNPHSAKHRRILRERFQLRWSTLNYAGVRPTDGRRIFNYARCARMRLGRLPSPGRHRSECI